MHVRLCEAATKHELLDIEAICSFACSARPAPHVALPAPVRAQLMQSKHPASPLLTYVRCLLCCRLPGGMPPQCRHEACSPLA